MASASRTRNDPGTSPGSISAAGQASSSPHNRALKRSAATDASARASSGPGGAMTIARTRSPPKPVGSRLFENAPMPYARSVAPSGVTGPPEARKACQRTAPITSAANASATAAANHPQDASASV